MLGFASAVSHAEVFFTDVTETAGVQYQQHLPQSPPNCVFEVVCDLDRMSGGAAVADVDLDGDPDLFVTRLDAPDILFENQGDGTFVDATAAAGFAGFDLQSNGAAFGDVDNDGDPDLFVVVLAAPDDPVNGRNFLFINDGTGHFTEEAVSRGADLSTPFPRALWSVNLGDYDRDGWLDVHLTEWSGTGTHGRLLRNLGVAGPGEFEDVTAAAGLDSVGIRGFASTFVDLDGDGWQDLAVAADFGTSRLYWNDGDGTFRDGTLAAGVGTDENGMGSTFGDFDLDGDLDWFVTSIFDPDETCEQQNCNWGYTGNRLYRNDGDRTFSDATDAAGVREGFWGWGTAFLDFDNDGDEDLVMTNGVDFPGTSIDAAWENDPMRFWVNDGAGGMTEASAELGIDDTGSGKGLLTFDYDGDGDLDVFVVNNGSAPRLYRNDLVSDNDWLRVQVEGVRTNRDGLGVQVWVQTDPDGPRQYREVGAASHFVGQSENVLHFGLGPTRGKVAEVTLYFPASGRQMHYMNVEANETLVVRERAKGCGKLGLEPIAALAVVPLVRLRRRKQAR
ncbi:MAG: CRTAC1 family protein [Myxococcota bacterium]